MQQIKQSIRQLLGTPTYIVLCHITFNILHHSTKKHMQESQ